MAVPKQLTFKTIKKYANNRRITFCYWLRDKLFFLVDEIDLRCALSYGEAGHDAGRWAELTGNMLRASLLLSDSPHVKFLEQYKVIGDNLFLYKNFEETEYFKNAMECVQITGNYFGQSTPEGTVTQARSFITLYERIMTGNSSDVNFPPTPIYAHSFPLTLPSVRRSWTPGTVQIDDGKHRFAILWVLGQNKTRAVVLPAKPTPLQFLVSSVAKNKKRRELYQPINSVEFDSSWPLVRRCEDRLK